MIQINLLPTADLEELLMVNRLQESMRMILDAMPTKILFKN